MLKLKVSSSEVVKEESRSFHSDKESVFHTESLNL